MALGVLVDDNCGRFCAARWSLLAPRKCVLTTLTCPREVMLTQSPAYAPVLLEWKAKRIIKQMDPEKGQRTVVRTVYQTEDRTYVVPNLSSVDADSPFGVVVGQCS